MTETGEASAQKPAMAAAARRRRRCMALCLAFALLLLTLLVVGIILAFTVFRRRDPETTLLSAAVDGVAPRVSFPAVRVELNVSLRLSIRVRNPNHASFRHGPGKSFLFYRGDQVGDADVSAGKVAAMGEEIIAVRLTIEAEKFLPDVGKLLADVVAGEVGIDASTRVPGRINFLGIFKRHAVAVSECHIAIGFPELKIRRQECKHQTKL